MNEKESALRTPTVTGYTMDQCRKIVDNAPARLALLDRRDTDYPAMLEIFKRYRYENHHTLSMMAAAFALGHAIGTRDERAKRRGAKVVPPDQSAIDEAENALSRAKIESEVAEKIGRLDSVGLSAILTTMRAMAADKSNAEAIEAGNAVLVAAGRKPLNVEDVRRNATAARGA